MSAWSGGVSAWSVGGVCLVQGGLPGLGGLPGPGGGGVCLVQGGCGGGGFCLVWGGLPGLGGSAWSRGCLPGLGVGLPGPGGIPACTEADPLPPCEQNE